MALNNKSSAQSYANNFTSYLDIANKPAYYQKLIQQYGDGLYMFDFLHMAGNVISVGNPTMKLIEEGAPERPVTTSIAITAAPLDVEITFDVGDGSKAYVREGFDILIPAAYTNATLPKPLRLYTPDGGTTWKGKAYDTTLAITGTITSKEFFLGASSFVRGSGQPKPMATGLYERDFSIRTVKDTAGIEGGMLARMDWEPVRKGSGKITSRMMTELEFRYNSQVDNAILLSELNTNAALTGTSNITGATSQIVTTKGMIPTLDTEAQKLPWTTAFGADQFDAVKPLLEGQGVTSRRIKTCVGTDLMTQMENDILEWLKTNTAVSDLYDGLEKAGFGVRTFKKNGYVFDIVKLDSFSNPNKYGGAEYPFPNFGFMFPDQMNSITDVYGSIMHNSASGVYGAGSKQKLANHTIGYVNNNGENRKRILKHDFGVNGMGYAAHNENDGGFYYLLTEFMNIFTKMNQTVFITK